jgi:hypothetical protein
MTGSRLSRQDAIMYLSGLHSSVASDRYVDDSEHEEGERELRNALAALGVTERELDDLYAMDS